MRSKLPLFGVIIVLGAGYMAAQPFRQSSPQPTASTPTTPRAPLRWNEPVPLQVTSSGEYSPSEVPISVSESEARPSFDRIPRIQASGEFAALADPPPQLAPRYEARRPEIDPFDSPAARRERAQVASTVGSAEPATASAVSPVVWPEAPRQDRQEQRVASLPTTPQTHPSVGSPRVHRVVDGDSLPRLAERYLGSASRYLEIYEANREMLASPDLLPIGIKLVIPAPGAGSQALQQQTSGTQAHRHPPPASSGLVPIGGV